MDGDVAVSTFHARQTFGGLFSKMDGLVMCKVYFHTGFLPQSAACVKFKLRDLDGVSTGEKYGPEFKVVVNYKFEKVPSRSQPIKSDWDLSLIFSTKADYEVNRSMLFGDLPTEKSPSPPPQAPPRMHRPPPIPPKPEASRTPSPKTEPSTDNLLIDDEGGSKAPPVPPKLIAESVSLVRPASDTLLLDLGFNGQSTQNTNPSVACTNPSVDILLNLSGSASATPHPEDPFFKPAGQVKTVSSSADLFGSVVTDNRSSPDLFGSGNHHRAQSPLFGSGASHGVMPDLFSGATSTSKPSAIPDLFGSTMSAPMPDLFGAPPRPPNRASPIPDLFGSAQPNPTPSSTTSRPPDLFGEGFLGGASAGFQNPVLSPTSAFQSKPAMSVGEELISNLLGDLDVKSSGTARSGSQQGTASQQRKPNYNSSFFQSAGSSQPQRPKAKITENTFNDLLGGFSASNGSAGAGTYCHLIFDV